MNLDYRASPFIEEGEGYIQSIVLNNEDLSRIFLGCLPDGGSAKVVGISQHHAEGEGDKWYWKVNLSDGTWTNYFNVFSVRWHPNEVAK